MDFNIIASAVLGSFFGFLATLASSQIVSAINRKSEAKSYQASLRLELKDALKTLEEIKNAQDKQNMYDFILLDSLGKNISTLQDMRRLVSLLKSEDTQKEVYIVVGKLSVLASEMRSTQNYEYQDLIPPVTKEEKDEYIKNKKTQHNLELIEIKRDITDLEKIINKNKT